MSFVAPNTSLRLGLPKVGNMDILALAGGRLSLNLVDLPRVGFGNVELGPCKAAVHNVTRIGLPIEVILGINAFVGRRIMIDYREGRIYLVE